MAFKFRFYFEKLPLSAVRFLAFCVSFQVGTQLEPAAGGYPRRRHSEKTDDLSFVDLEILAMYLFPARPHLDPRSTPPCPAG